MGTDTRPASPTPAGDDWTGAEVSLTGVTLRVTLVAGLHVLVVHQAHHRGQMTVLMRQAGLLVPSIYGPVKEGWSAYGVEPPRV